MASTRGEPIAEDDNLFGIAVISEYRNCRVLISRVVDDLCASNGFEFSSVALSGVRPRILC